MDQKKNQGALRVSEKVISGMGPQDPSLPSDHPREQRKTAQRSLSQNPNLQNCEESKMVVEANKLWHCLLLSNHCNT